MEQEGVRRNPCLYSLSLYSRWCKGDFSSLGKKDISLSNCSISWFGLVVMTDFVIIIIIQLRLMGDKIRKKHVFLRMSYPHKHNLEDRSMVISFSDWSDFRHFPLVKLFNTSENMFLKFYDYSMFDLFVINSDFEA